MHKVAGRAYTLEEKKAVLARLLAVWTQYEDLRLGQLLDNAITCSQPGPDLYYVEDRPLCDKVESFLAKHLELIEK